MKAANTIRTGSMIIIAMMAWFGLVLQLYLIVKAIPGNHLSLASEIFRYFSYFTILTNLLVAISLTSILISPHSRWGKFFGRPEVQSAIALYIGVVGITYSVALRHVWNPKGWQLVADRILHDAVPIIYVLYWAFFVRKQTLQWKHPLWWLLYPAFYLVFVVIRGILINKYPYHFIDRNLLSWPEMIRNIAVLFAVFVVLGFLMVGVNRLFRTS
jgi:hypothetical protein